MYIYIHIYMYLYNIYIHRYVYIYIYMHSLVFYVNMERTIINESLNIKKLSILFFQKLSKTDNTSPLVTKFKC